VKVVVCRRCGDILTEIGFVPVSCRCGNVVAHYWNGGAKFTVAIAVPTTAAVYGYSTPWLWVKRWESNLRHNSPIRYILTWPWRQIYKLWIWGQIGGKICWRKPFSQAICRTSIGMATFYTYD